MQRHATQKVVSKLGRLSETDDCEKLRGLHAVGKLCSDQGAVYGPRGGSQPSHLPQSSISGLAQLLECHTLHMVTKQHTHIREWI